MVPAPPQYRFIHFVSVRWTVIAAAAEECMHDLPWIRSALSEPFSARLFWAGAGIRHGFRFIPDGAIFFRRVLLPIWDDMVRMLSRHIVRLFGACRPGKLCLGESASIPPGGGTDRSVL